MSTKQVQKTDELVHQENSSTFEIHFSSEIVVLANKAADEELTDTQNQETKKEFYLKIAQQLEVENIPKEKISKLTVIAVEQRLELKLKKENIPKEQCKLSASSVRYLRMVMREKGYTDPFYARNTKGMPDDIPRPKSSYENQNMNFIHQMDMIEEYCKKFKEFLKNNDFEMKFEPEFVEEYMEVTNAKIFDCLQGISNKQKIEKFQQYLLFQQFAVKGISGATTLYRQKIKDYSTLTPKQVKKFMSGITTHLLDIFTVTTKYEATQNGYYGTECKKCKSLRMSLRHVDKHGNEKRTLHCWACHADFKPPQITIPKLAD